LQQVHFTENPQTKSLLEMSQKSPMDLGIPPIKLQNLAEAPL
jgi:hypothetical protein